MVVSASELLDATCEECIIFEKCLFSRFPTAHGWGDPRYATEQDKKIMKENPNGRYRLWEETFGKTVCPLFISRTTQSEDKVRLMVSELKNIKGWCEEELKIGQTTKDDFDAQVVKFKALKELNKANSDANLQTSFQEIQSLLMKVYGGIANGNK